MTDWPTWDELKKRGSEHYKTGGVQVIDILKAIGIFIPFAFGCIIKYACRCAVRGVNESDMGKIVHYAQLIMANHKEQGGA